MSRPIYAGKLDRRKMNDTDRCAYEAYCGLKARSKKQGLEAPQFNAREFMGWWLESLKTFKGHRPTCGRIDHSKGYSFDNIEMQDMKDNSREGMLRNKTNIKTGIKFGKKVAVRSKTTNELVAIVPSIRETAELFGLSQRLVQFIIRGKYKESKRINFNLEAA